MSAAKIHALPTVRITSVEVLDIVLVESCQVCDTTSIRVNRL